MLTPDIISNIVRAVSAGKYTRTWDEEFELFFEVNQFDQRIQMLILKEMRMVRGLEALTLEQLDEDYDLSIYGRAQGYDDPGDRWEIPPSDEDEREAERATLTYRAPPHKEYKLSNSLFMVLEKSRIVQNAVYKTPLRKLIGSTHRSENVCAFRDEGAVSQLPLSMAALVMQTTGKEEELVIALKKFLAKCNDVYRFYQDFCRKTGIRSVSTMGDIDDVRDTVRRCKFFDRDQMPKDEMQEAFAQAILKNA